VVARWAHNPKVAGSSPAPATKTQIFKNLVINTRFFYINGKYHPQRKFRRQA
jgi:hypothetical protein